MHWWRVKRRNGAWIALCALLLQLALSFGHIHRGDFAGFAAAGQSAAVSDPQGSGPDDHGTSGSAHDECLICATMHLAGALVLPAPPAIVLPGMAGRIPDLPHAEFSLAAVRHSLFQSRAPPTA